MNSTEKEKDRNQGNWIDRTNRRIGNLVGLLVPVIAFVLVYELIMRYGFNRPTIWAHEISQFIFGITFMLGAGYTLLQKGHVNMDLIYGHYSPKTRAKIDLITALLIFLYLGVLVWKSGYMAIDSCRYRETLAGSFLRPPIYPMKVLFFIGCLLFMLQAVSKFIKDIKTVMNNKPPEASNKETEK